MDFFFLLGKGTQPCLALFILYLILCLQLNYLVLSLCNPSNKRHTATLGHSVLNVVVLIGYIM